MGYQYQAPAQYQYQTPTATASLYDQEGKSIEVENFPALPLSYYMKMKKNYNTDSSYNGYNNYNPIRTVREAGAEPEADAQYYYNYQAYPYHSYARTMYNRFPYTFSPYNAFNGYYYHY